MAHHPHARLAGSIIGARLLSAIVIIDLARFPTGQQGFNLHGFLKLTGSWCRALSCKARSWTMAWKLASVCKAGSAGRGGGVRRGREGVHVKMGPFVLFGAYFSKF